MYTQLMLIEKIQSEGTVQVFQAHSGLFHWGFENRRRQQSADAGYFPFYLDGPAQVVSREAGAETRISARGEAISFSKDYALPGGTVVGILFPANYVPGDFSFKQKPYILVDLAAPVPLQPPGQMDLLYNEAEKRCAIIFHIHKNSCFAFSCQARRVAKPDFAKQLEIVRTELVSRKPGEEVMLQSHEVMRMLKISDRVLMRRRQNGTIPYTGSRGNYLYKKSDIEGLLAGAGNEQIWK